MADGPFHNVGTPVPDRTLVGFKQGGGVMTQTVTGLIPGQSYWVQFFYDSRANSIIDLTTQWDGTTVDTISGVLPVTGGAGYRFRNVVVTPTTDTGVLGLGTVVTGDSTGLWDGVCMVPRNPGQIIVMNPSFEASGTPPAPGTLTNAAGWTGQGTGSAGVNDPAGPYADNGTMPEQDHVAFLQGDMTISQTLRGLALGENYAVTFRYNAKSGNTPRLAVSVDGSTLFNQAVTPVGGVAAYRTGTVNFTAGGPTAVLSFAQTAAGDQTVLLDDIQVAGVVVEPIPNVRLGPTAVEVAPGGQSAVSVKVSAKRLESGDSTVILRMANPAVAKFVDADVSGSVFLTFLGGAGDTTLTTMVEGVSRGNTAVVVEDNGGHDGVDGTVVVNTVTSFVRNPSFETTGAPVGVGYGLIAAWQNNPANSGINAGPPFFDNGQTPDGRQVGFLQGSQVLSQAITGLTPGQRYWVQAFYNARGCCGGTIDLTVRMGGTDLATVTGVTPVGSGQPFEFLNAAFVASSAEDTLEFVSTAAGDASVLIDGVCIVPASTGEIVVKNPSFEASGFPVGVGYTGAMAGWSTTGGHGVNIDGVGPFGDNGVAASQDRVGFIQGNASLSQTIDGFTAGSPYTLSFLVNGRNSDTPGPSPYRVLIDGTEVLTASQDPVGNGNPYNRQTVVFTPAGTSVDLRFESLSAGTPADDQSLLLDDIHIFSGTTGTPNIELGIRALTGNSVDISWPATAPANLLLQSTTNLVSGPWVTIDAVPFVEGGANHVLDVIDTGKKFYRLAQP